MYHKVLYIKRHKGHKGSQSLHKDYANTIPFLNHTLYSREDPRPLVTASSAIMTVVDFAKDSTMYLRVVISSPVGD
jgi:hypothetical protein